MERPAAVFNPYAHSVWHFSLKEARLIKGDSDTDGSPRKSKTKYVPIMADNNGRKAQKNGLAGDKRIFKLKGAGAKTARQSKREIKGGS